MSKFVIRTVGGAPLLVGGKSVSDVKYSTAEGAQIALIRILSNPHLLSVRAQSVVIVEEEGERDATI